MSDGERDDESVRDVLVRHSDSRPCRTLFEAVADGRAPTAFDARDYVEVLRATDGELCVVVSDGAADVYLHWAPDRGFEQLSVWPPWSVVDYDAGLSRAVVEGLVRENANPRPLVYGNSPFAHGGILASLPGLGWP